MRGASPRVSPSLVVARRTAHAHASASTSAVARAVGGRGKSARGGRARAAAAAGSDAMGSRRRLLASVGLVAGAAATAVAAEGSREAAEVESLRAAMNLFQAALNAGSVEQEEKAWTDIVEKFGDSDFQWTVELVSRALGNRGNARSRQGRQREAIQDYNRSIEMTDGKQPDPILNRGVAYESLFEFDNALADYRTALRLNPEDAAALNNIGNVQLQTEVRLPRRGCAACRGHVRRRAD